MNIKLRFKILFLNFVVLFIKTTAEPAFEERYILAKPVSLCNAYTAGYGESNCIYYNPAGLIFSAKIDLYLSYTKPYSIDELNDTTGFISHNLKSVGIIGLGYNSFGSSLYKEDIVVFSYSNRILRNVSYGINIKSFNLNIKNYGNKSVLSIDTGITGFLTSKVVGSVVVKNVNMPELAQEEKISSELVVGTRIEMFKGVPSYIDIKDITKFSLEETYLRLGQEIVFSFATKNEFVLRCGVETATRNKPAKYAAGLGIKSHIFAIDYALLVHPYLGLQHLVSCGIKLGQLEFFTEEMFYEKKTKGKKISKEYTGKPINLNTATEEELLQLPGIGPSTAKRIIELRIQKGKFSSIEELLEVPRIGKITLERIKPYIYIEKIEKETQKEEQKVYPSQESKKQELQKEEIKIEKEPVELSPAPQPEVKTSERYNINTVTVEELKTLGFSSLDARNIVRYRERKGKFSSIEELYKVPNIDKKMVDQLKEKLIVE